MIVGIDIGGSTTDAVILENGGIQLVTIEANDPVAAAAGALGKLVSDFGIKLEDVECVAATGAGSRVLTKSLLGRPVVKVNEFTAIGIGGTSLAGLDSALVVSLGTGTAIVSATRDKIEHVSGTGVGGGTLLDNTLVVFWNECSNGNAHGAVDMPVLLFGGKFLRGPGWNHHHGL